MKKLILLALTLCGTYLLAGCGSGSPPPPLVISVALTPNSAPPLDANQSDSFTATVNNDSSNQGVKWTVTCPAGVSACGTMAQAKSASGAANQYVAPANVGAPVTVTATATSVTDPTKSASVQVTVNPALALVNPPPAPPQPGLVGGPFSFNLANFVQGGTAPFTWTIKSGTLPVGLALDSKTGMITGTPTAATTAAIVIVFTCADSGNPSATPPANPQIALTINAPPSLTITSGSPPSGVAGRIYDVHCNPLQTICSSGFFLKASGGISPYHWSWAPAQGSSLPPGLRLTDSFSQCPLSPTRTPGVICGIPSAPGSYVVIVTVTDSASPVPATQTSPPYTIIIAPPPPPVINATPAPSAGAVNLPYSFSFTASSGLSPLTWNETGALPPGLAFGNDGVLSGTPTATGSFPITVMVQDSAGQSATPQDFTIQIFPHGFKTTGSMGIARVGATATLLRDGKVLVAGGEDTPQHPLATAEVFDPTTGAFAATSSMATARVYHAAALLKDGKVLVTGGFDTNGNTLTTAEVYDPTSGAFAPTGSMQAAYNTATLLNNGKVLMTGGIDANRNPLATAELFDPASGSFTPTGSMGTARDTRVATLLNDGKVLVAGGWDGSPTGGFLATAEIYDPVSGSFAPTGSMTIGRDNHTATLLNGGKVLVAGGSDNNGNALAEAELFDPTTGTFTPTGNMQSAHWVHRATLLSDGTVLVTGGLNSSSSVIATATAELFDPRTGTFALTGSMTTARELHGATLLNDGRVLVTGGSDHASFLATAELYQ
jgi:hypothetical protein